MARLIWTLSAPVMALAIAVLLAWASYQGWSLMAPPPVVATAAEVAAEEREQVEEDFQEERDNFNDMCDEEPNCRRN